MGTSSDWSGAIHEEMTGSTRILTIENGPKNLLNPVLMNDLQRKLEDADDDPNVLAVMLTGAGEYFCGGLDISAIQAGADPVEFAHALVDCLRVIPTLGVPLAAAVNGDALASGASYVAACDYAVAANNVSIGTIEVSVGIWPMIAQVPVIHRLGARAAIENIGSGEPFTAERARELGLVQLLTAPGEEVEATMEWLTNASRAPKATPEGRRSLYEFAEMPYEAALEASLSRFVALFD